MKKKSGTFLFVIVLCALLLTGCERINRDTRIVLTTGFTEDEIFRIETASCYKKEVMVYLTNLQNQYEQVYGTEIWEQESGGMTLGESVKESVLAELAQIKTMNLMADKYGVELDKTEQEQVEEAAQAYYASLNDTEKEKMDVTLDTIRQLYREYALADKVYEYIIQDINPEISDDEARTITLQQILIRTENRSGDGEAVPYTDAQKEEAHEKAREALRRARDGEDFDVLVSLYNEAEKGTVSIRKGESEPEFEQVAFDLGNEEVSGIFETQEGYYILKCISTFDKDETDANKKEIVEQRRQEIFTKEYDSYVETLTRNMNEKLWEEVGFIHDEEVTTSDFFMVYTEYCS